MIIPVFYMVPSGEIRSSVQLLNNDFIPAICLDTEDFNEWQRIYQFLSEHPEFVFSIAIRHETELTQAQLEQLAAFCFLPSFFQRNGQAPVFLIHSLPVAATTAVSELADYLDRLGLSNIRFADIGNRGQIIAETMDQLLETYAIQLRQVPDGTQSVMIKFRDPATHSAIKLSLGVVENDFKNSQPELAMALERIRELLKLNAGLKTKNGLLEEELKNYRTYNKILQTIHPDRELQRFYDREYEALPRWYKRFGHIIKAIMGKRRWSSLVNDRKKGGRL
ncbi:MAG: hypothetical protein ABWZ25_19440 [Chitinophagaceae bacterium]